MARGADTGADCAGDVLQLTGIEATGDVVVAALLAPDDDAGTGVPLPFPAALRPAAFTFTTGSAAAPGASLSASRTRAGMLLVTVRRRGAARLPLRAATDDVIGGAPHALAQHSGSLAGATRSATFFDRVDPYPSLRLRKQSSGKLFPSFL